MSLPSTSVQSSFHVIQPRNCSAPPHAVFSRSFSARNCSQFEQGSCSAALRDCRALSEFGFEFFSAPPADCVTLLAQSFRIMRSLPSTLLGTEWRHLLLQNSPPSMYAPQSFPWHCLSSLTAYLLLFGPGEAFGPSPTRTTAALAIPATRCSSP